MPEFPEVWHFAASDQGLTPKRYGSVLIKLRILFT